MKLWKDSSTLLSSFLLLILCLLQLLPQDHSFLLPEVPLKVTSYGSAFRFFQRPTKSTTINRKTALACVINPLDPNGLLSACSKGVLEEVLALLEEGGNVDARDAFLHTPLHVAALNNYVEIAMALIEGGADMEARNDYRSTPLHSACWHFSQD